MSDLQRCPACGKLPVLVTHWVGYPERIGRPLYGAHYECSHWFKPNLSTAVMWNEKDWADLARRRAREAWDGGDIELRT